MKGVSKGLPLLFGVVGMRMVVWRVASMVLNEVGYIYMFFTHTHTHVHFLLTFLEHSMYMYYHVVDIHSVPCVYDHISKLRGTQVIPIIDFWINSIF